MVQVKAKVLLHKRIAPDHLLMRLEAPAVARQARPGQFLHVQCDGDQTYPLLRRPFSLLDVDTEAGTVDFIYKVVGLGTEVLSDVPQGDRLDLLGPLGSVFTVPAQMKRAYLVGGGVGIPPLYFLAKELMRQKTDDRGQKIEVKVFLGARTEGWVICEEMFRRLGVETHVATDDGTLGHKGSVVDLLKRFLHSAVRPGPFDAVRPEHGRRTNGAQGERGAATLYICGPTPMMEAAAKVAQEMNLAAQVSLEERMGCAMGCCMGCVVEIADEPLFSHKRFQRVCTEGPVFPAESVIWRAH